MGRIGSTKLYRANLSTGGISSDLIARGRSANRSGHQTIRSSRSSQLVSQNRRRRPVALRHSFRPKLDVLEARTLLSVMPLPEGPTVQLSLIARPLEPSPPSGILPAASSQYSPPYSPAVLRHAYGVDQLGSGLNGSGQTIAIVDAFDDPTIASDLSTFDQKFGLPRRPSSSRYPSRGLRRTTAAGPSKSRWTSSGPTRSPRARRSSSSRRPRTRPPTCTRPSIPPSLKGRTRSR